MENRLPPSPHKIHTQDPFATFHDGVRLQNLLLNPGMLPTDGRQELQDKLRGLCLPCSALPTDNDTLVTLPSLHEVVGIVCCGKDVRRFFSNLLVFVAVNVGLVVDGKELVGVDGYQNRTCQSLDKER